MQDRLWTRQAIIWTNADILSIGPQGTYSNEILLKFKYSHSRKCIWKCRQRNGALVFQGEMSQWNDIPGNFQWKWWKFATLFLRIWKGGMIPRCHLCNVQMRQLMHWILKCPLWSSSSEFELKYFKLSKLLIWKTALLIRAIHYLQLFQRFQARAKWLIFFWNISRLSYTNIRYTIYKCDSKWTISCCMMSVMMVNECVH